jgi:hypothetical protein
MPSGRMGAVRSSPGSILSHDAAAIARGLPTLGRPRPCATVPAGAARRNLASAHLHRATLPDADRTRYAGYPTTSVARTVLDIAREHGVDAGVVTADAALHGGQLSAPELAQPRSGRAAARALAELRPAGTARRSGSRSCPH